MLLVSTYRLSVWSPTAAGPERLPAGEHLVDEVLDGPELRLANGAVVRLQGLHALPSSESLIALEAKRLTAAKVDAAERRVHLSFLAERLAPDGVHLAFVETNGVCLNEELVRLGVARANLDYRSSGRMKRRLAAAQAEAREAKRGLWVDVSVKPSIQ
ncbi:MAG: thermonuclease family protein [Planctomycetota bacterium]